MFSGSDMGVLAAGSDEIAIFIGAGGYGGILAAAAHAPIMSTLMICENDRQYQLLPGLLIACVVASGALANVTP